MSVADETGVRIVLNVGTLDEVLHAEDRPVRAVYHFNDVRLNDVHFLRRVHLVELVPPQLGVHLQLDVIEVRVLRLPLDVALGDVVGRMLPVLVSEIRELLPEAHGTHGAEQDWDDNSNQQYRWTQ